MHYHLFFISIEALLRETNKHLNTTLDSIDNIHFGRRHNYEKYKYITFH